MARYSADHKSKTRARLLDTARREFREHGFEAASIDRIMKAAGLTRGGFYAHFASKEELVREVLRIEPGLLRQLRELSGGDLSDGHLSVGNKERAAALFAEYLEPAKRSELIYCPLVAHAMDSVRGGSDRSELYSSQIQGLIERVSEISGSQRDAILTTVLAVGAAILSSATDDVGRADEIERVCSDEITRRLTGQ